ncbi:hypothetical protein F383_36435 [Gossypium arboreum]|uniref:Uncharacterized protein n=1 Tax=Gossypium arboreum TaxID=29729 RepID=A0A0B0NDX4_GOSAR|nr:hypothetical protein F383_36435 [Gossypium arboreum]
MQKGSSPDGCSLSNLASRRICVHCGFSPDSESD